MLLNIAEHVPAAVVAQLNQLKAPRAGNDIPSDQDTLNVPGKVGVPRVT